MPDDDYEEVPDRLWISFADNNKLKNAIQIRHLLKEAERTTVAEHATVYLIKVLRLMNGIE